MSLSVYFSSKMLLKLHCRTLGQSCWSKFDPGLVMAKVSMMGAKVLASQPASSHVMRPSELPKSDF